MLKYLTLQRMFLNSIIKWFRSSGKSVILILTIILICVILLEFSPYLIYPALLSKKFIPDKIQGRLLTFQEEIQVDQKKENNVNLNWTKHHVLHPYLGFVHNYKLGSTKINDHGFYGKKPIMKKSNDKIIIGIMGGSFARGFYADAQNTIIEELSKSPEFSDRKVELISIALGGYKQPQQLIALNYLLYLGAEFDIIINLDGFNEVAVAYKTNILSEINPFFPRAWDKYARKSFDKESIWQVAHLYQIQAERQELNNFFTGFLISSSNFCLAIWDLLDLKKQKEYFSASIELDQILSKSEKNFQTTGPDFKYRNEKELFINLALKWYQASVLMSDICKSSGIAYYHFIQPNQYYKGSKEYSNEEIQMFNSGSINYKKGVSMGYPLLIKAGGMLAKQGINFVDLTMIFRNDNRTLYSDNCCHLNELGYSLIAKEIVKTIKQSYFKENTVANSKLIDGLNFLRNSLRSVDLSGISYNSKKKNIKKTDKEFLKKKVIKKTKRMKQQLGLTEEQAEMVKTIMLMRNRIIHTQNINIKRSTAKKTTKKAKQIISDAKREYKEKLNTILTDDQQKKLAEIREQNKVKKEGEKSKKK